MTNIVISLLLLGLGLNLITLVCVVVVWWRQGDMERRMAHLEAQQALNLSTTEVRQIYEQLASINGRLGVVADGLNNVQRHLLENE